MIAVAEAVCVYCGGPLTRAQEMYCSRICSKNMWRRDPENRDRDNAASLRWKRENREHNRQINAAKNRRDRPYDCAACGRGSATPGICGLCKSQAAAMERRFRIRQMWSEGASMPEIAAALETNVNVLGGEMVRMRKAGWDLPYRYNVGPGGRRRA